MYTYAERAALTDPLPVISPSLYTRLLSCRPKLTSPALHSAFARRLLSQRKWLGVFGAEGLARAKSMQSSSTRGNGTNTEHAIAVRTGLHEVGKIGALHDPSLRIVLVYYIQTLITTYVCSKYMQCQRMPGFTLKTSFNSLGERKACDARQDARILHQFW